VAGLLHERRQPEAPTILGHMVRNTFVGRMNLLFISVMIYVARYKFRNVGILLVIQTEPASY